MTAPPVERTVRAAAPVEITPEVAAAVAPSPAPAPAATPSRSTPIPAPETADVPAEAGEGARRLKVTRRGKQGVTFSWPAEDLARVEQVYRDNRSVYRKQWRQQDPGARYELGFSAFTAHALTRALTNVNDWIGTVRNDARLEPIGAGQKQKALMWPLPLAEDLHDLWEDLEVRPGWPDGFHLTKAHLAMAGILSALPSVGEWLMQVPNDDRYQLPPAPRDT